MARIRTVKPEFFTSPDIAALEFPARQLFQALWCWADDFGIGETNLNGLLGFAFPDSDGFTAEDLRRFCAALSAQNLAEFYTVRGRHFYSVVTWDDHQKTERRAARRKNPLPDDPDATPDLRIHGCADFAPEAPRKSAQIGADPSREQGKGNRGKGTGESTHASHLLVAGDEKAKSNPTYHRPPTAEPRCPHGQAGACGECADQATHDVDHRHGAIARRQEDQQALAELTRAEIDDCPMCDDTGYRGSRVCSHDPDEDARRARGIAEARAALEGRAS